MRISVLTEETKQQIAESAASGGLCLPRFKADVVLPKVSAPSIQPGFRFTVDGTGFEVTSEQKKCHPECPLVAKNTPCCLAGKFVFAESVDRCIGNGN